MCWSRPCSDDQLLIECSRDICETSLIKEMNSLSEKWPWLMSWKKVFSTFPPPWRFSYHTENVVPSRTWHAFIRAGCISLHKTSQSDQSNHRIHQPFSNQRPVWHTARICCIRYAGVSQLRNGASTPSTTKPESHKILIQFHIFMHLWYYWCIHSVQTEPNLINLQAPWVWNCHLAIWS